MAPNPSGQGWSSPAVFPPITGFQHNASQWNNPRNQGFLHFIQKIRPVLANSSGSGLLSGSSELRRSGIESRKLSL
jgi:hypothetical protein